MRREARVYSNQKVGEKEFNFPRFLSMEMLPVKLDEDMIGDDSTSYVSLKRKQESSLTLISEKIVLCFQNEILLISWQKYDSFWAYFTTLNI